MGGTGRGISELFKRIALINFYSNFIRQIYTCKHGKHTHEHFFDRMEKTMLDNTLHHGVMLTNIINRLHHDVMLKNIIDYIMV